MFEYAIFSTRSLTLLITLSPILSPKAQEFTFPQDDDFSASSSAANLSQFLAGIRGTNTYERYVDNVIAGGVSKLTLAISRAAATQGGSSDVDNVIYSPASIAGALALLLLASNGKTFDELANFMGLATGLDIHNKSQLVHEQMGRLFSKLEKTSGLDFNQVQFATAVFVQNNYPVRDVYRKLSQVIYKSDVVNVDFASNSEDAKNLINNWVLEHTNQKIRDILSEPPSTAAKSVIVSALYFQAKWEKPFFDGATKKRPFYTNGKNNKDQIQVEMMANGGNFPYYKDEILDCSIMGFPYKGNQTTMYVVLPNNSTKERLKNFENSLTPFHLQRLLDNTKYTASVILFPKMKIEATTDLKKILQTLGLNSLFNPTEANLALLSSGQNEPQLQYRASSNNDLLIFSRSSQPDANTVRLRETLDSIRQGLNGDPGDQNKENPGLFVNEVLHKVYIDITESGTEAAAATSVSLSRDGGRVVFRVDVPFLFFIMHEETKMVLFWGSVTAPSPKFD